MPLRNKDRKGTKMKKTVKILLLTAAVYLIVCVAVTGLDYMKYMKTRTETSLDTDLVYGVYSEEETAEDLSLDSVLLYHFPAPGGKRTKCVIYLPGGSYTSCNPYDVCVPAAAEAAEMGYSAFVLTYRVGEYAGDLAPAEDVANGIRYIFDHAEELNVDPEGYMLTGFSAGGHLAGLFASEAGYKTYDVPKPGAVGLAYPLINVTEGFFENWNAVSDFVNSHLRNNCIRIMLGKEASGDDAAVLDIMSLVTPDYPPTFLVQGDKDFLVRSKGNADLMAKALEENAVPCEYRLYHGLTHGFGIGTGTEAEGWNRDAILFWTDLIAQD